ncbi:MAG: hypothetical protein KAJ24_05985, partial [Candidatus Aenigmarchaeota archaeon]|nr:hypothetical protein [Candidatus Aenigmarchaeota archaeon]
ALERCFYEETHYDPCPGEAPSIDNPDPCLKTEYRECTTWKSPTQHDCDDAFTWVNQWNVNDDLAKSVKVSDTVAIPFNILPNVDDGKPAETISVCENSWLGDVLDEIIDDPGKRHKCITVTPDASSMGDYSDAGFGTNYCATNENTFWQEAADKCFWGSIALSLGIEVVSAGGLTPVVLYVVGSGAVACEKIAEMDSKWPKNQFG